MVERADFSVLGLGIRQARSFFAQEVTEATERINFTAWVTHASLRFLCYLLCTDRLLIGSGQDQSGYPVGQLRDVKIDEQPDRHIEQLHVAQKLRFVNGQ